MNLPTSIPKKQTMIEFPHFMQSSYRATKSTTQVNCALHLVNTNIISF